MKMSDKAKKYTAFTIPGSGQFCWRRAPMGLSQCPASFCRLMDEVFAGLSCAATYVDDLACFSKSHNEHIGDLRQCFNRLRAAGLKINPLKCVFAAAQVKYLGHTLSVDGIRPGKDKSAALRDCAPPASVAAVRSFIGLANFFRKFIPNFASIAAPLYKLTSASRAWHSGTLPDDALRAFTVLRNALTSSPVLAFPQRLGKYHLFVDAASGSLRDTTAPAGLGACLLQDQSDGRRRVVAYASRVLLDHEKNYSAFLIELAAVV
jgi:hypothetical protein